MVKVIIDKLLNLSIGTKLTLAFIVLVSITAIPLSIIVIKLSEKVFYDNIIRSLNDSLRSEELQIRYYIINRDYWNLFKLVKGLAEKRSVLEAAVVDEEGKVLAHSSPQEHPIGSFYGSGGDIVDSISGLGSGIGSVVLVLDQESIWEEFKPIRLLILFAAFPFTGLSIFFGVLISSRINTRLSKIRESIERIRRGDLRDPQGVQFREKDELQDFADFLLSTISTMRTYYDNIEYAQRFYMNLLNAINEIVFVIDREERIFYTNSQVKTIGYSMDERMGMNIREIIQIPEGAFTQNSKYSEVIVKGKERKFPALMGIAEFEDWEILTLIDISERKSMEEKIRRMEIFSTLGEMSANFAHELKNAMLPLGLLSSVNRLSEEDISVIKNSISRMGKLINMFLNFAKPVSVERTKFRISTAVEEVLSLVSSKIRNRNIRLVKDVRDAEVVSSRDLIQIILINLVSNAIDAVGGEGEVGVKVYIKDGVLMMEVWDSGHGIPRDEIGRIFEPFYTTKDSGYGLGLSIVLRNVYLLKGNIHVSSEKGGGTVFKVNIPLRGVQDAKRAGDRGR